MCNKVNKVIKPWPLTSLGRLGIQRITSKADNGVSKSEVYYLSLDGRHSGDRLLHRNIKIRAHKWISSFVHCIYFEKENRCCTELEYLIYYIIFSVDLVLHFRLSTQMNAGLAH